MLKFFRLLTPAGIWMIAGLVLAIIVGAMLLWNAWQSTATVKAEKKLATNQTEAALESGVDAVETAGVVHAAEVTIDVITRENERAIREAPGADAPVDPAVHAAGLASLCRRAAYRGQPECLLNPDPE
ncbi:MAG: hypothetical protein ACRDBL_04695 [Rhabdaerophilum sp.]